jgi:hypothetical protein
MTGFMARRVAASLGSVIESPHKLGGLCFDLQSLGGPLVDVKASAPHTTQLYLCSVPRFLFASARQRQRRVAPPLRRYITAATTKKMTMAISMGNGGPEAKR